VDAVECIAQGVVVEIMWINGDSEEKFGVLFGDKFLHFVEWTPTREGVADHASDEGSQVKIGVAWDAPVDQIDEPEAVAHPSDGRDVANSQHGGIIDKLLCGRGGVAH